MAEAEQKVLSDLRKLILNGELGAGEKISEVSVAKMLKISRTPAKFALARLEMTGLITKLPGRGYIVREVRLEDVENILLLRGVLEGTAAGYMATNGISGLAQKSFSHSLRTSGEAVAQKAVEVADVEAYQTANTLFHNSIMKECGNEFIVAAYDRIRHFPMAEIGAVAPDLDRLDGEFMRMSIGHAQHTIIHDAIVRGDAMRAEMVMREHSRATLDYARLFVGQQVEEHVPSLQAKRSSHIN